MRRSINTKHFCCCVYVRKHDNLSQATEHPSSAAAKHACNTGLKMPDGLQKTDLKKDLSSLWGRGSV